MGFPKDYANKMRDAFGFEVVWPPNARVRLGDYGEITGAKGKAIPFKRHGNISAFGIKFGVRQGHPIREKLGEEDVSIIGVKAAAKTTAKAVELDLTFTSSSAVLFEADGMVSSEIEDLRKVGAALARVAKQGKWDSSWVLVTNVQTVQTMTLVMSEQKGRSLRLAGNAQLSAGNLVNASADISLAQKQAGIAEFGICAGPHTPLFQARVLSPKGLLRASAAISTFVSVTGDVVDVPPLPEENDTDAYEMEQVRFNYCDSMDE
jgi:hypothetical protein